MVGRKRGRKDKRDRQNTSACSARSEIVQRVEVEGGKLCFVASGRFYYVHLTFSCMFVHSLLYSLATLLLHSLTGIIRVHSGYTTFSVLYLHTQTDKSNTRVISFSLSCLVMPTRAFRR